MSYSQMAESSLAGPSRAPFSASSPPRTPRSSKAAFKSSRLSRWLAAGAIAALAATVVSAAPSPQIESTATVESSQDSTTGTTTAAATTSSASSITTQPLSRPANIVDLSICLCSVVGSLLIMFPFFLNKGTRKLRYSLIFGLASSDLIVSLNIAITVAYTISGKSLTAAHSFCSAFGFLLSVGLYTQHFWNFSILVITYMLLVHPLSSFTLTIERRFFWLWPIIWSLAVVINIPVFPTAGFGFSGGYCYIPSTKRPALFGNLYSFVPRVFVVTCILILYTRLFFFLRRANIFSATSASMPSSSHMSRRGTPAAEPVAASDLPETQMPSGVKGYLPFLRAASWRSNHWPARSSTGGASVDTKTALAPVPASNTKPFTMPLEMKHYAFGAPTSSGPSSREALDPLTSPTDTRLPSFKVSPTSMVAPDSLSSKGDNDDEEEPYVEPILPLRSQRSRSMGDLGREAAEPGWSKYSPTSKLATLEERPKTAEEPPTLAPSSTPRRGSASFASTVRCGGSNGSSTPHLKPSLLRRDTTPLQEEAEDDDDDDVPDYHQWAGLTPRMKPRADVGDFKMISAPREHLRHYTIPAHLNPHVRNLAHSGASPSAHGSTSDQHLPPSSLRRGSVASVRSQRRPSNVVIAMPDESDTHRQQLYENVMSDDWAWGTNVTAQDYDDEAQANGGMADAIARRLGRRKSSVRNGGGAFHDGRRNTAGLHSRRSTGVDGGVGISRATASSSSEEGIDSMGSTLNRQASALLLLYPLAYMVLFSLSMARIIRDFATTKYLNDSYDPLRSISRWMIFAQGAMDCIIFKVIERHFQLRMKRKRARAHREVFIPSWEEKVAAAVGRFFKRNYVWVKDKKHEHAVASEKRAEEKRASACASATASATAHPHPRGGDGHRASLLQPSVESPTST